MTIQHCYTLCPVWRCCIWVETWSPQSHLSWLTSPVWSTWFCVTTASKASRPSSTGKIVLFIPMHILRSNRWITRESHVFVAFRLHSLLSLSLHNNLLTFLPREILSLVHLQELSLRGNPLVVRFIKDMTYNPPSLIELAGRTIKSHNLLYLPCDLPSNLIHYLNLASECPNPKCAGRPPNQSSTVWRSGGWLFRFCFLSRRCLLRLVCEAHQVCRFLWEVPPAAHALPLFSSVLLSVQLKSTERSRVRGWEQRTARQTPKSTAGLGWTFNRNTIWFQFNAECVYIFIPNSTKMAYCAILWQVPSMADMSVFSDSTKKALFIRTGSF